MKILESERSFLKRIKNHCKDNNLKLGNPELLPGHIFGLLKRELEVDVNLKFEGSVYQQGKLKLYWKYEGVEYEKCYDFYHPELTINDPAGNALLYLFTLGFIPDNSEDLHKAYIKLLSVVK